MTTLTKRERVEAALRGIPVDRVPVAAWRHFIPEERSTTTLADASLRFFTTFDWDWLKVNPRATLYAEAWGNQYDFDNYHGVLPRFVGGPFNSPADLQQIQPVNPTGGVFGEHLDLLRRIGARIGAAHFVQTVFSPLSVLAFLLARPTRPTQADAIQAQYDGLRHAIAENPQGAHAALAAITETLAGYAAASLDIGASGIFFAIVKLARVGVLTEAEYVEFGRPYDLKVLQAVQEAPFNLLHICGPRAYFDLMRDYPVHALNWATVGQENPTLAEARARTDRALVGGVDEEGVLQHGTPALVMAAAQAAVWAVGKRSFLLTPGCGVAVDVPAANLRALRKAVEFA